MLIIFCICGIQFPSQTFGQEILPQDSAQFSFQNDSLSTKKIDSLGLFSSNDSIVKKSKSPLDKPIDYNSLDSMIFDLKSQKVYMYGGADVKYGDILLKANFIEMDFNKTEVYAKGLPDSTGKITGKPEFEDDGQNFKSSEMRYNFKTQKGLISDAQTQQSEGFIEGKKVKKLNDDVLFIEDGEFCPCEDPEAGTFLRAKKLKIIKDDKIVTGPAYLVIENIPTPLALPFAILPNKKGKASGIIIPKPGSSPNQGFFLNDGGYYWTVNEYIDASLTGDIYSRGSWGTKFNTNYRRRYKYNGNLNFDYSVFQNGLSDLPTTSQQKNFFIRWNHKQDNKARPNSNFSASVNAGTQNNFTTNFNSSDRDYLTNTFKSNITYNYSFPTKPINLSLNASHSQNSKDTSKVINITLPEAALTVQRIFPFKRKNPVGKQKWYETIGLSYIGNFKNTLTTTEKEIGNGVIYDPNNPFPQSGALNLANMQNGVRHNIPLSTSFKILKHFTVSPSVGYTETWYFKKNTYEWDDTRQLVNQDTINGFNRYGRANFNASLSTNIYGMYTYRSAKIKAIRHVMTPSIGFNYSPNTFNKQFEFQSDTLGNRAIRSGYEGFIFGGPSTSETGSISFNLRNNVEMKVLSKNDTSESYKKVKIFDQLNFATQYNIFADSLNWSPLQMATNINLLNLLTMRINATFDPYTLNNAKTRTVNTLEFDNTGKLARMTNFTVQFSYRINNSKRLKEKPNLMPWSLDMAYNYNYSKPTTSVVISQSARFNGKVMLTDKWDVGGTTNFDFRAGEFSYTSVNVYRDLNCWELAFSFIPFGTRKSYSFSLNVKPALLKDLKLERRREWFDIADS